MNKIILTLKGLDCANCAAKIESNISRMSFVDSCNIDFLSKKLTAVIKDDAERESSIKLITKEIKKSEPHVEVSEYEKKSEHNHSECSGDSCSCHSHEDNPYSNLFAIIISSVLFIISFFISHETTKFLVLLLSYIVVGYEVIFDAVRKIFRGKAFDEAFLMTIATIGAFCIGKFSEGVTVMLFYQIGEFFQGLAVHRSRKSISELMDIRPDYANLKKDGNIRKVNPDEINIGDIIVVKPGEKIPLDGIVTCGSSNIDVKALTGESMPVDAETGTKLLSGSVNLTGVLEISVTNTFETSTATRILELVENAGSKKTVTEKFITRFAKVYTPFVVITALILAVLPPLIIPSAAFSDWIYRALVFLVISCPCALVISVPLSFFGGIGGASRSGILIKGANALEQLSKTQIIAFDKTGTLTEGSFNVTDILSDDKEKLIEIAAHLESFSSHPVARCIVDKYGKIPDKSRVNNLCEVPGLGIKADFDSKQALAGNRKLMEKYCISFPETDYPGTHIFVAYDGKYVGTIVIADKIKKDAAKAISDLKKCGVTETVLLTGDKDNVGRMTAKKLGIDTIYTELLPSQKVEIVETLMQKKKEKSTLAFVGDGINDAPVLARADVGIAMGEIGSDCAVEAADIVLMTDEPIKIVSAVKISKKTVSIVKQNIVFALAIKAAVLIMGALGFATMWLAVFADVGVSLLAILNALRAMKKA